MRRIQGTRPLTTGAALVAALVFAQPATAAPAPPANVQATGAATQVALSWNASTGASDYIVERDNAQIAKTDAYTTNFLDTGLSAGTHHSYTVIAEDASSGSAPSAAVNVGTQTAQQISSCGATYSSGSYVLAGDLQSTAGQPCLQFTGANVTLDCQGHTISDMSGNGYNDSGAVTVNNTDGFLLVNCNFYNAVPQQNNPQSDNFLAIVNSSNGAVDNDTFTAAQAVQWVYSSQTSNVAFNGDDFINAPVSVTDGTGDFFGHNRAMMPSQNTNTLFSVNGSAGSTSPTTQTRNTIADNVLDSSSSLGGYAAAVGADDALSSQNEAGDILAWAVI